jgi:hypothetical protein
MGCRPEVGFGTGRCSFPDLFVNTAPVALMLDVVQDGEDVTKLIF